MQCHIVFRWNVTLCLHQRMEQHLPRIVDPILKDISRRSFLNQRILAFLLILVNKKVGTSKMGNCKTCALIANLHLFGYNLKWRILKNLKINNLKKMLTLFFTFCRKFFFLTWNWSPKLWLRKGRSVVGARNITTKSGSMLQRRL